MEGYIGLCTPCKKAVLHLASTSINYFQIDDRYIFDTDVVTVMILFVKLSECPSDWSIIK